MTNTTDTVLDLARMMIKQAKLLKNAGLMVEARELARRAMALNALGRNAEELVPVRTGQRRR